MGVPYVSQWVSPMCLRREKVKKELKELTKAMKKDQ